VGFNNQAQATATENLIFLRLALRVVGIELLVLKKKKKN
jgi:hypothetical protein